MYIWVAFALVPLLAGAALAVDTGFVLVVRTQLQGATDAAAIAVMREIQDGSSALDAADAGRDIALASTVIGGGGQSQLYPEDIYVTFGDYDFDTRQFRAGGLKAQPAARVTSRRALDLLLAPLVRVSAADVLASGVAALGCREIVLVQDVGPSWSETQFGHAKQALKRLVSDVVDNGRPGDRIGLVAFGALPRRLMPLRSLPGAQSALESMIDYLKPCTGIWDTAPIPQLQWPICRGTDHGRAIVTAVQTFRFGTPAPGCGPERLIVIVSDGSPCRLHGLGGTIGNAQWAADTAYTLGVSIAPMMLIQSTAPADDCPPDDNADRAFNTSLARGFGRAKTTDNSRGLRGIVPTSATEFPVRLVR